MSWRSFVIAGASSGENVFAYQFSRYSSIAFSGAWLSAGSASHKKSVTASTDMAAGRIPLTLTIAYFVAPRST